MKGCRVGSVLFCCALLAACGTSNNDYKGFFTMLQQGWGNSFSRTGVSLKEAAAIPFASMGWRLNGGDQSIIVLATDTAGVRLWTSKSHIVLQTIGGLITRTVGLPKDLQSLLSMSSDHLITPAQGLHKPYTDSRVIDLPGIGRFNDSIVCHGRAAGMQNIVILGKKIKTTKVIEDCSATALRWSFQNNFWVDQDTGAVWRSEQSIAPGEIIETEVFRPPE